MMEDGLVILTVSALEATGLLAVRLDRFARWQAVRAVLQIATLPATIWAAASRHPGDDNPACCTPIIKFA